MSESTPSALSALPSLSAIFLKRARRGPMDQVGSARLRANLGLEGNVQQGNRRQITLLEEERWQGLMRRLGADLPPRARRANLIVRDIDLSAGRGGRILRVGACRIQILGETRPCARMEGLLPGLEALMVPDWGGGAFGIALDDGTIEVGASLRWDDGR